MKTSKLRQLWIYLKHFVVVALVVLAFLIPFGISQHASLNYGDNPLAYKVGDEGPFVFFQKGQLHSLFIRGGREQGFSVEDTQHELAGPVPVTVRYQADGSVFQFDIDPDIHAPASVYDDGEQILAISDLEGNFGTFRDFLIAQEVMSLDLEWQFGRGHLVLVGDMVDRGVATTQLLWLVYKLEQEARRAGGQVHYIIGNHEIKNMQGNFTSANEKYIHIAGILGKQQADLFGPDALIGRWMASKNTVERINGVLFAHGGLQPQLAEIKLDLPEINEKIRHYYRQMYYPGVADEATEKLISSREGPAWYRGYFRDDLGDQDVQSVLDAFAASAIVVGHTLQFKVNEEFDKRVYGIDVKHPSYYRKSFPPQRSEGLLIKDGVFYRALDNGERKRF